MSASLISARGCMSYRCPIPLCSLGAAPAPNPSGAHTGGDCLSHVPVELSVILRDAGNVFVLINICKEINSLDEREGAETAESGTEVA